MIEHVKIKEGSWNPLHNVVSEVEWDGTKIAESEMTTRLMSELFSVKKRKKVRESFEIKKAHLDLNILCEEFPNEEFNIVLKMKKFPQVDGGPDFSIAKGKLGKRKNGFVINITQILLN